MQYDIPANYHLSPEAIPCLSAPFHGKIIEHVYMGLTLAVMMLVYRILAMAGHVHRALFRVLQLSNAWRKLILSAAIRKRCARLCLTCCLNACRVYAGILTHAPRTATRGPQRFVLSAEQPAI